MTLMNDVDSMDYDIALKVCLVGDMGVGKTCIIKRYTDNTFTSVSPTVAVDFVSRIIKIDDKNVRLTIYDTAGQERFRSIHRAYYKQADIIVFVYDCSEADSLFHVESWYREFQKQMQGDNKCVCVMLGNKIDLPRNTTDEQVEELKTIFDKERFSVVTGTCSALTGEGITDTITEAVLEKIKLNNRKLKQQTSSPTISEHNPVETEKETVPMIVTLQDNQENSSAPKNSPRRKKSSTCYCF
ncbi:hypothetical protein ABK040_010352 [Willaertia magna]